MADSGFVQFLSSLRSGSLIEVDVQYYGWRTARIVEISFLHLTWEWETLFSGRVNNQTKVPFSVLNFFRIAPHGTHTRN